MGDYHNNLLLTPKLNSGQAFLSVAKVMFFTLKCSTYAKNNDVNL